MRHPKSKIGKAPASVIEAAKELARLDFRSNTIEAQYDPKAPSPEEKAELIAQRKSLQATKEAAQRELKKHQDRHWLQLLDAASKACGGGACIIKDVENLREAVRRSQLVLDLAGTIGKLDAELRQVGSKICHFRCTLRYGGIIHDQGDSWEEVGKRVLFHIARVKSERGMFVWRMSTARRSNPSTSPEISRWYLLLLADSRRREPSR